MMYYESLTVYQKAFTVNSKIYCFLKQNKTIPTYMKNQLGRATLSIMLNIAEGTAKISGKDRRNFYVIARGSTFECYSLLKFLHLEKEIPIEIYSQCESEFMEISKMLFTMIKNQSKFISN